MAGLNGICEIMQVIDPGHRGSVEEADTNCKPPIARLEKYTVDLVLATLYLKGKNPEFFQRFDLFGMFQGFPVPSALVALFLRNLGT